MSIIFLLYNQAITITFIRNYSFLLIYNSFILFNKILDSPPPPSIGLINWLWRFLVLTKGIEAIVIPKKTPLLEVGENASISSIIFIESPQDSSVNCRWSFDLAKAGMPS
jgi:hypothetical protein